MSKALLAVFTVIVISGCQFQQLLPTLPAATSEPKTDNVFSCSVGSIEEWLMLEQKYQQAKPTGKSKLLTQAKDNHQTAIRAILLSQPDNTTAQLKRSIELFEQLELEKNPECDAEHYLLVRYQYTQAVLTLQRALNTADLERKELSVERDTLKQQIDALTRIEKDLSRQKDGEEK
ncbi:hypothetical protein [Amphritea japonica]|uniref:Lipoprotein n=1 Tax=Amphritea japonica ATCC BAA-1530 TaxID=1278309 RepID=A0A7R6P409_9GAMM|nr:hypothetical protein [Amphritea japonica]BBB26644.1 conserved hypothetical protein [Amphritea japonica ATCC BAA-1530]